MEIRRVHTYDLDGVRAVIVAAFGRTDEADLVENLRVDGDVVLECVAVENARIVGHILYSGLDIVNGTAEGVRAVALAPLSVWPEHQNTGIGLTLTSESLELARAENVEAVIVLGDPAYYSRFGFTAAAASHLTAPFSGDSFMALELVPGALDGATKVTYPRAFGAGASESQLILPA